MDIYKKLSLSEINKKELQGPVWWTRTDIVRGKSKNEKNSKQGVGTGIQNLEGNQ